MGAGVTTVWDLVQAQGWKTAVIEARWALGCVFWLRHAVDGVLIMLPGSSNAQAATTGRSSY